MTISTTVNKVVAQGNGATTAFSYAFLMPAAANAVVTVVDNLGNQTVLINTQYSLAGIGNANGGTLNYPLSGPPLASGWSITLQRVIPLQQLTSLINQAGYFPNVVEGALDSLEMQIQQISAYLGGNVSLQFPAVDPPTLNAVLPAAAARAGMLLSFDSLGNVQALAAVVGTATALAISLASSIGTTLVGFIQAGAGAVLRTLQAKLRDIVSSFDFGSMGNYNGTTGTDDTAALQSGLTYIQTTSDPATYATNSPYAGSSTLNLVAGNYKVNGTLTLTKKVALRGDGPAERSTGTRLIQFNNAVDLIQIAPIAQGMSFSLENMTLAGTASGAGDLVHAVAAAGACNSARVLNNFFGTPPTYSIAWEKGDDLQIVDNVFDASNGGAVSLGTTTAANVVSNANIENNDFFEIPTRCFLIYNALNLAIVNNRVTRQAATRTNFFVDGYNSLPFQLTRLTISGNRLNSVDCMAKLTAVAGLTMVGNEGVGFGSGAGATISCIELTGVCSNVIITGNNISGSYDTKNFYNDAGATVTGANISGNTFINTGGTGQALLCGNTSGVIANNNFVGFTTPSVSQKVTTSGSAINTGLIAAGATFTSGAFTVTGARAGDSVKVGFPGTTYPLAAGLTIDGLVTANDTVKFVVRNGTAGALTPAAFDITYVVERGA